MKKLLAIILFILIIFTSCKKVDIESNNVSKTSVSKQKELVEQSANEKLEIESIAKIEPELVTETELIVAIKIPPTAGVINDTRVRLRSEPNLESETLEYLNTGDKLRILDRSVKQQKIDSMSDYWYKVQVEGYPVGWVYGAFVDFEIVWFESRIEDEVRIMLEKPHEVIMKSDLYEITKFKLLQGYHIEQIDDIAYFTNLTSLNLYANKISDISPLSGLTNLTELNLERNDISDISPLSNLTKLTDINLNDNPITDLSSLSSLTNLTKLWLNSSEISDLSPLTNLSNLTTLFFLNTQVSDLSPLSGLTNLVFLVLRNNNISDISSLSNLNNLTTLYLNNNNISDLSSLSVLTNLTYLDLASNNISDLSPVSSLTNLSGLNLYSNNISILSPLSGLNNLTYLDLSENRGTISEQEWIFVENVKEVLLIREEEYW